MAASRLEPLIRRAEECAGIGQADKSKKLSRKAFAQLFDPILAQALELRNFLVQSLHIAEKLVEQSEFDRLCEVILNAINQKLDYSTDDRLKTILASIIYAKRMLQLPVSASLRRRLEQNIRSDTDILYKNCGPLPNGFDASQCWFLAGAEASPDDSFEMPVYKITKVTAATAQWESPKILVPRSALAAKSHRGKLSAKELLASRDDEKTRQIRRQIEELQAQSASRIEALGRERDEHVARQLADQEVACKRYDQEVAAQESQDKQAIARGEKSLADGVAKEKSRSAEAQRTVQAKHKPAIDESEKAFQAASQAYRGLGRVHCLELPASAGMTLAVAGAAALCWQLGVLSPGWGLPMVLLASAGAGSAVGFAIGRLIRAWIIRGIRTPLTQCERARNGEIQEEVRKSKKIIAAVTAKSTEELRPYRDRLAQYEKRRAAIRDEGQARVASLKKETEKQIDRVRQDAKSKLQAFEKKLAEGTTVRPESGKTDFPPYRQIKGKGYRDGARPPEAETQQMMSREMTSLIESLSQPQRMMLAALARQMSTEQFANLLTALADASPAERRRMLNF